MSILRWAVPLVVLALVLTGFLHRSLLDGIDGEVLSLLVQERTEYASGNSDAAFRAVDRGMSEATSPACSANRYPRILSQAGAKRGRIHEVRPMVATAFGRSCFKAAA
jgi:hypothetical protein